MGVTGAVLASFGAFETEMTTPQDLHQHLGQEVVPGDPGPGGMEMW